jgi:hypothetical protein
MPNLSSGLAIEETTLLFCAVIEALIPLLIWLFWDLEQRRQRWAATRGRVAMMREKA